MIHSLTGLIHLLAALLDVVLGARILFMRKATRWHRRLGYVFVTAMLVTDITALTLFGLNGRFNLLHGFAIVSLVSLALGMYCVLARRPDPHWFDWHLNFMTWSYIGLIAALVSETATRIGIPLLRAQGLSPQLWFWIVLGLATALVMGVGGWLLARQMPALEKYRPRARRPGAANPA